MPCWKSALQVLRKATWCQQWSKALPAFTLSLLPWNCGYGFVLAFFLIMLLSKFAQSASFASVSTVTNLYLLQGFILRPGFILLLSLSLFPFTAVTWCCGVDFCLCPDFMQIYFHVHDGKLDHYILVVTILLDISIWVSRSWLSHPVRMTKLLL